MKQRVSQLIRTLGAIIVALTLLGLLSPASSATGTAVTGDPNPQWPNNCGIDVDLLIDHSNSIQKNNAANPGLLKDAAKSFADALEGTPSRLAVHSFWKTAQQEIGFTDTDATGVAAVKTSIDSIPFFTSDSNGSTNWDEAFRAVENLGAKVVFILTDGNPTVHLGDYSSGGSTDQADIDEGVKSANRVKSPGLDNVASRIVSVGIGSGVSVANLKLISGPNANDDYFVTDFATLKDKLATIASKLCGGSITVKKLEQRPDGSFVEGSGWTFHTTLAGGSPPVVTSDPATGITDVDGVVNFKWQSTQNQDASVVEEARPGFGLQSAACEASGKPLPSSPLAGGVRLTVGPLDIVQCLFKNVRTSPGITVHKTATPSPLSVGGTVHYAYTVTNTGNLVLTNVTLADDKLGGVTLGQTQLAPGESTTGTATHVVTLADLPGPLVNVATAKGTPPSGPQVTDTDDATVTFTTAPSIHIDKSGPAKAHAGDPVGYTFAVTNTGDVPLTNVSVDDDVLGHIGDAATLAIGETKTFTLTRPAGTHDVTNTGTACGSDPLDKRVCDDDHHTLDVIHPDVKIVKTAAARAHEGDVVTYSFTVTNTGDVPLTNVSVDDDILGHIGTIATLAVAAEQTLTKPFTALSSDTHNVGTVCGNDPLQRPTCDTDDHTLDVVNPAIHVVKSGAATAHQGDAVTYGFVVTNTGDVALTNVTVDDDVLGHIGSLTDLSVGESKTLHFTTIAPADDVTNTATACGRDPLDKKVCDTDDHVLDVIHPAVTVDKTAATQAHEGDAVVYTFTATNTGDVALTDVSVDDDVLGHIGDVATLGVGAAQTLTKTAPAPSTDTRNVAKVCGDDPLVHEVCGDDDHTIDIVHPGIHVDKTGAAFAHEGDDVTYTFTVHNTGDIALTNVTVDDDVLGSIGTIASIAAGASAELTKTMAVPASSGAIDNVATVCGLQPGNLGQICDTDIHHLTVIHPALTIDKQVAGDDHKPEDNALLTHAGTALGYTVLITNTGDTPLEISALSDSLNAAFADSCSEGTGFTLAPAGAITCAYTTTSGADDAHNVAEVTGVDRLGGDDGTVNVSDETFVRVIDPSIAIVKTPDPKSVEPGQSVTYTYDVTNTGTTELSDVVVTDDILGTIGTIASLAPGETKTLTKAVTIREDSPRTNIGTACGVDATGLRVCASDSATIAIVLPVAPHGRNPNPVLPRTGFNMLLWIAISTTLVAAGLTMIRTKRAVNRP